MNRAARRAAAKAERIATGARAPHPGAELRRATDHHRAGRLAQAEAIYRDILRTTPREPDALHLLGLVHYQTGRPESAADLITRAIALNPGVAAYHDNLGLACRMLGRCDEAVGHARRALALDSGPPGTHLNLATALMAAGDPHAAAESFRAALARDDGYAEAHNGLGTALAQEGRHQDAARHFRRALALRPDFPEAHNNLANSLMALGRAEEAIEAYRRAIALDPEDADSRFNLGLAYADADLPEQAAASFRESLAREPDNAQSHLHLARALERAGEMEQAATSYRAALARAPSLAEAYDGLGKLALKQGEVDEALVEFRAALELGPDTAALELNIGSCLQRRGRFEEAVAAYERARSLAPTEVEAYLRIAGLKRFSPDDPLISDAEALLAGGALDESERRRLTFVVGKIRDDCGDYELAFRHFRAANDMKKARTPFDAATVTSFGRRLAAVYDDRFFAAPGPSHGSESEIPVFIVGMPRSGTSLIEQILASHPQVHGAGERTEIGALARRLPTLLGKGDPFPDCAGLLNGEAARGLASGYLDAVMPPSTAARRVTDKMPANFLYLGLIWQLFPRARVIHCRRDPMDTCLSCYFQDFDVGHAYAQDLEDLGLYYRRYEALMAHWRSVLPLRMLEVSYEAVVADLEKEAREVVAFCGLDWDDRCLAFHRTRRTVTTASYWQVRQPLYASSVGRWRHYEAHLEPLARALAAADEGAAP